MTELEGQEQLPGMEDDAEPEPEAKAEEAPVEDKRRKGPRERQISPVEALHELLSAWAIVIHKDPGFQAVLASVPRNVRRQLAREFAHRVVSIKD